MIKITILIANEDFEGSFPFKPHYKMINGFKMHYIDEGNGEPIICVHGEPTWGYLYRKFILELSKNYRVIVPDHMGFGKSEIPQDKPYTMTQHVDNLTKLILELDLKNITMIFQDWGGPISFGFATRYPDKIKRLVIMNTSIGVAKESRKLWFETLIEQGKYDELLGDINTFVSTFLMPNLKRKMKYKEKKIIKNAYIAPFPDPASHIGVKAFPLDIPKGQNHVSSKIMQKTRDKLILLNDVSKILIWGMKDPIFPPKLINWWKKIYPNLKTYEIEEAGHFLQEDAPEKIIKIIQDFLKSS